VICLVISLIAGGLGLTNVSVFAKRVSLIFFALFSWLPRFGRFCLPRQLRGVS